jgi:CHAD domain-containing protein
MHFLRLSDPPAVAPQERQFGIGHWIQRVLEECEKAGRNFAPGPVHDLRVAVRRCRSLADGMRFIDPDPGWKRMRRAGKPLFSALGELRDTQVLQEWVERLAPKDDPSASELIAFASREEVRLKDSASFALHKFDRKQWSDWINPLSTRASRMQPGAWFSSISRWSAGSKRASSTAWFCATVRKPVTTVFASALNDSATP